MKKENMIKKHILILSISLVFMLFILLIWKENQYDKIEKRYNEIVNEIDFLNKIHEDEIQKYEELLKYLETTLDYKEDYFKFLDDVNIELIKQGKYMDIYGTLHEYKQKISYKEYQENKELLDFYEWTIETYTENGESTHWQQFFLEQKQKNSAWYREYLRIESKY